jgi:hypothetical protein
VASLLILNCFIDHLLADGRDRAGVKRALDTLRELEYIIRDKHIGETTQQGFGNKLDPVSILTKYLADERLDSRVRDRLVQGILDRL